MNVAYSWGLIGSRLYNCVMPLCVMSTSVMPLCVMISCVMAICVNYAYLRHDYLQDQLVAIQLWIDVFMTAMI